MGAFYDTMQLGGKVGRPGRLFHGQHTNEVRARRRRAIKAAGGIRQFKKANHG